jgi:hypothetical protein
MLCSSREYCALFDCVEPRGKCCNVSVAHATETPSNRSIRRVTVRSSSTKFAEVV